MKNDSINGAIESSSWEDEYFRGIEMLGKSIDFMKLITSAFANICHCGSSDALPLCGIVKGSMITTGEEEVVKIKPSAT